MGPTVCLAVPSTLARRGHGAHRWIFLNWALGLEAAGGRVVWLEAAPRQLRERPRAEVQAAAAALERELQALGLGARLVVASVRDGTVFFPPGGEVPGGVELLVNFVYGAPGDFVRRFRRRALVDLDPGLLGLWMSRGQVQVAAHDAYFTIGETVGTGYARFPDGGVAWSYTPPPVFLPAWPVVPAGARYTTVTGWWDEWLELEGESFANEKRAAFLDYLDLPARCARPLELALILDRKTAAEDVPRLEAHGWAVTDARRVCQTAAHFRRYVQASRGEFTCQRPSCRRLGTTWIGDRTVCYLASGKPAVVEWTAPGRLAFADGGLLRFATPEEAAAALAAIESDYERHARQARRMAEEHFDAAAVAGALLERALP